MITPLYGQLSPLRIPTSNRFISTDADVSSYILAVESADGQQLEAGVISAVESFITGCKSDGIWSAIKASCILAGARTLSGALVPLVGTAPTNNNFVSADYNRKAGLIGNGTNKQLNANRSGSADPQNNVHQAVYVSQSPTNTISAYIGHSTTIPSYLAGASGTNTIQSRFRVAATGSKADGTTIGFKGQSRSLAASYIIRTASSNATIAIASTGNPDAAQFAFSRASSVYANARLSYYSIGESLNLALLDTRVSNLMTALAAAIP